MNQISKQIRLIDYNKNTDFYTVFEFPYAITGKSYKSEIRDEHDNLSATFTITQDNNTKTISLSLTPLQKSNLVAKEYYFDVIEIDSIELPIIKGIYQLDRGVTQ